MRTKKGKDTYLNCSHTQDEVGLTVKRYYIDNIPVCMSWYGCVKHPREACQFLLVRHFGTIPVCGLTGEDMNTQPDIINAVPDWCPLHYPKRK